MDPEPTMEALTIYEIVMVAPHRKIRITVPSTYKVTYGNLHPGMKGGGYGEPQGAATLRFYESDTKQRAVFRNVTTFRDISLPIQEERVVVTDAVESSTFDNGEEFSSKVDQRGTKTYEWKEVL